MNVVQKSTENRPKESPEARGYFLQPACDAHRIWRRSRHHAQHCHARQRVEKSLKQPTHQPNSPARSSRVRAVAGRDDDVDDGNI